MANFVLIHGSFQGGWIWKPTVRLLRDAGHIVHVPTMEGCAERRHGLSADITATTMAREVADLMFYEDLDDVILGCTSSGGLVISKAAEFAPERIKRLVYIDALAPQPGETTADIVIRDPDQMPYEVSEFARGPSREMASAGLFEDVEQPLLNWALDRITLHPKGGSDVNLDKFWAQSWSATVICCTESVNPSEAHQRRTAEKLNADWHEMASGHYPMLNHPDETARLLMQAAER